MMPVVPNLVHYILGRARWFEARAVIGSAVWSCSTALMVCAAGQLCEGSEVRWSECAPVVCVIPTGGVGARSCCMVFVPAGSLQVPLCCF